MLETCALGDLMNVTRVYSDQLVGLDRESLRGPFGVSWLVAIVMSEALFLVSRANVQDWVSIDDPFCWLAGLSPFLGAALAYRLFGKLPRVYLEVWIVSLAAIAAVQLLGLSQFIEYPLFLRFDEGYPRSLAYSAIYATFASFFVMIIFRGHLTPFKRNIARSVVILPAVALTMALTLFPTF